MSKTDPKSTDIKAAVDKAAEDQKAVDAKADEEQAAADAKAAEDQAAADAKAAEEKAAADAKAAEDQAATDAEAKLDVEKLRELSDLISANADRNFTNIRHRLEAEEGLKFRETSEGRVYARMAGIEGGSRGGEAVALQNWANAARRALLKAA